MKNWIIMIMACLSMLACKNENYGIGFQLGNKENEIVSQMQESDISHRYENNSTSYESVLRVKHYSFEGMEFNTVRLCFKNGSLCYIQYRVHDNENIDNVISYLKKNYGACKEIKNKTKERSCYWGDMNKFIIVEDCGDEYVKVHVGDAAIEPEVSNVYKELIVGTNY